MTLKSGWFTGKGWLDGDIMGAAADMEEERCDNVIGNPKLGLVDQMTWNQLVLIDLFHFQLKLVLTEMKLSLEESDKISTLTSKVSLSDGFHLFKVLFTTSFKMASRLLLLLLVLRVHCFFKLQHQGICFGGAANLMLLVSHGDNVENGDSKEDQDHTLHVHCLW